MIKLSKRVHAIKFPGNLIEDIVQQAKAVGFPNANGQLFCYVPLQVYTPDSKVVEVVVMTFARRHHGYRPGDSWVCLRSEWNETENPL